MADEIELHIDRLAAGGDGVGRAPDGRAVFVPFTAPGDRARVRLVETRARFARGEVVTLLEASPQRTDPLCEVFGSCGGCAWQHVRYDAQLEAKRGILEDALERVGHLSPEQPVRVTPSPSEYGYRGRTRLVTKNGRVGYRRRRSHAICAVRRCPVLMPALDGALAELADHPPQETSEWELIAGADGSARSVALTRPLPKEPSVTLSVAGDAFRVSPGVFVQANGLLLDELARCVHEAAGRGGLALELFCGAGFLTLGLARRFERVIAVESEGRAVEDLQRNLAAAGLANVEVVGGRAEHILDDCLGERVPDLVVLDPPRVGLPPELVDAVADTLPHRIVYVSCDPATLARDLARFVGHGYRLQRVQGIDLFPQTPHVEAVATLVRAEP